ncbi:MAG: hypothetical protein K8U57_34300 [Planctomycetes bacterium]|nr:hypothetical protein [Planctomycetota bacterium]
MRTLILALASLYVALPGCADVPRGRITGTVKHQGKPLTDATVIFLASDNQTHPVDLKADGSFEVACVAFGQVKVSVQQGLPPVSPKGPPTGGSSKLGVVDEKAAKAPVSPGHVKATGPRLAANYANAEQSGLTFEMHQSNQEWSVDLR